MHHGMDSERAVTLVRLVGTRLTIRLVVVGTFPFQPFAPTADVA
jgi:hypothetical protein